MKKDLKHDILVAARSLFNERGYNSVSMRDIADSLNISVGNLTYHYNRKEELIEAIVMEMYTHYRPKPAPTSMRELDNHFTRMSNNLRENAYYFAHYVQLAQICPSIRAIQAEITQYQHVMFSKAFESLFADGLLAEEEFEGHRAQLIKAVQIIFKYWTPQTQIEPENSVVNDFNECVWSVIFPVLTKAGKEIYLNEIRPMPPAVRENF